MIVWGFGPADGQVIVKIVIQLYCLYFLFTWENNYDSECSISFAAAYNFFKMIMMMWVMSVKMTTMILVITMMMMTMMMMMMTTMMMMLIIMIVMMMTIMIMMMTIMTMMLIIMIMMMMVMINGDDDGNDDDINNYDYGDDGDGGGDNYDDNKDEDGDDNWVGGGDGEAEVTGDMPYANVKRADCPPPPPSRYTICSTGAPCWCSCR